MRKKVESLVGYGYRQDDICRLIINPQTGESITRPTLEKHFRNELDTGALLANVLVVESMHQQAVGRAKVVRILEDGTQEAVQERVRPVPVMGIWWSKNRMGWREQPQRHEHGGINSDAIKIELELDLDNLTVDQLRAMEVILESAQSGDGEETAGDEEPE